MEGSGSFTMPKFKCISWEGFLQQTNKHFGRSVIDF